MREPQQFSQTARLTADGPESNRQAAARRAVRPAAGHPAGLDDAAGRALPAGISRAARPRRQLSRSLLHAGDGGGGHAAADPALSASTPRSCSPTSWWCPMRSAARCGSRPAKARASIRSTTPAEIARLRTEPDDATLAPVYEALRLVKRELDPAVTLDRLLRRAVDGRDLHGGGPRHARPGAGAAHGLSRAGARSRG